MTEIIKPHQELIPANRLAHIPHHIRGLRPSMHAMPIIFPLMIPEPQPPLPVAPGLDAQLFVPIAEPFVLGVAEVRPFAPSGTPAVFGEVLAARDALVDGHGRRDGTACPGEGVDGAEVVGVVFEVHVGGELGGRVGEEVFGGAGAGDLAQGVEVRGPPDWVPDLEVFFPLVVVDGAGVGGIPRLVEAGRIIGISGVGEDRGGFFGGVVEDSGGEAVEDAEGARGGCCVVGTVDDVEGWSGGWSRIPNAAVCGGFRCDYGGCEAEDHEQMAPNVMHFFRFLGVVNENEVEERRRTQTLCNSANGIFENFNHPHGRESNL